MNEVRQLAEKTWKDMRFGDADHQMESWIEGFIQGFCEGREAENEELHDLEMRHQGTS